MKKPKKQPAVLNALNEEQLKKDKADFLEQLKLKPVITVAAKHIGKCVTTIWNWRQDDPEFDRTIESVLTSRTPMVVDALFNSAMRGNVTAQIFYLVNKTRMEEAVKRWESVNKAEPLATERLRKLPFVVAADPNDPTPPDSEESNGNHPAPGKAEHSAPAKPA